MGAILPPTMKLTEAEARTRVWKALLEADGDRAKAAELLACSRRTLDRYIRDLDLYPQIDSMGWLHHAGPPRGVPKGSSIVRQQVLSHLRKTKGKPNYGELAVEIYGVDNPTTRQRIYSAIEDMKQRSQLMYDDKTERWTLLT